MDRNEDRTLSHSFFLELFLFILKNSKDKIQVLTPTVWTCRFYLAAMSHSVIGTIVDSLKTRT